MDSRQDGIIMKTNISPTAYPELNDVLKELVTSIQEILGQNFLAAYLQGSFAVGDADLNSDVDFLVIVKTFLTSTEIASLNDMHRRIFGMASHWAQHLEGSYFPEALLKSEDPGRTPIPYVDNGSTEIELSNHDNELVVRWAVREHGIPLVGPPPSTFINPVPAEKLKREVRQTMRDWGEEILSGGFDLGSRWAQPYVVLSYCRMLHTQETGRIESKPAGANWASKNLDPQWKNLIDRAWADRDDKWRKVFMPSDPQDQEQTRRFIRYAISQI
jgi:predicted nucleotidyltransferase